MPKPPERQKTEFEKVKLGEFVPGIISDIEYDKEHVFRFKDQEKTAYAVRIVFKLDGYEYPHRTRWLNFNYGDRSNLYSKYLLKLVDDARPEMDFDLDRLKEMKVKTIWQEKNNFQSIELIQPIEQKLPYKEEDTTWKDEPDEPEEPEEA